MRQIVLAIAVLAVFATAQNVLAIAPTPVPADRSVVVAEVSMQAVDAASRPVLASAAHADATPPVSSTALLFVGLAGLTVAGGRRERVPGEVA